MPQTVRLIAAIVLGLGFVSGLPLLADPPPVPGDANGDGVVDGADYTIWADHYAPGVTGQSWEDGDFNGDTIVNGADYTIWADQFHKAPFRVAVTVQNNTGAAKTNWPVFLTVWKLFGSNIARGSLNPDGFHVYDAAGQEIPHMRREIPPDFTLGSDEIVFIVPQIASGASLTYYVTNTWQAGMTQELDLVGNANNLLPNGGFESGSGVPTGYTLTTGSAANISYDTTIKKSGTRSMLLTLPVGSTLKMRTSSAVSFTNGRAYHFSIWARCENVAYNGWGFTDCGLWVNFDQIGTKYPFTGREMLTGRDNRPWFCYRFDAGSNDSWGVPMMGSLAQATGTAYFRLNFYQQNQPFLAGAKTGKVWLDEALLLEQPAISVDRQSSLSGVAKNGKVFFARPINMPRHKPFAREAVEDLSAFAMRGERRQVRFGIYAFQNFQNLLAAVSALTGPAGTITTDRLDLERLNDFIEDNAVIVQLAPGEQAEYVLGMDVPADAAPGVYTGWVTFTTNGQYLAALPLTLEVLPVDVPSMHGYYIGGIYNIGFDLDRDDRFYTVYGKIRFNFLMLFDYFSTHKDGAEVDLASAAQQVEKMRTLAHVTGGIGLYREPNMSEDQPRKWYQIASGIPDYQGPYTQGTNPLYKDGYQDLAEQLETYAQAQGWPDMIYMVSDEPDRVADQVDSMGWLNERLPNAITNCDAQFHDMIATWDWYNLPILDDPVTWTGPLVYDYVRANKSRFGICGVALGLSSGRYQPGLMMASSGAIYWHWWHVQRTIQEISGKVIRMHHVAAMGAGANDLRYYLALKERIANSSNPALKAEAQAYLDGVFGFATADHDRHTLPYNGVPADWGDERWYDDWRGRMKDYILLLDEPAAKRTTPIRVARDRRR